MTKINNEVKVRWLTKLFILKQAKVMSFKDIEIAWVARTAKDVIKGKGKRGRKRKSIALEVNELKLEPELEVARAAKNVVKGRKRRRQRKIAAQEAEESEPEVARMIDVRVPWRAPIARIIWDYCKTGESFLIALGSDLVFGSREIGYN